MAKKVKSAEEPRAGAIRPTYDVDPDVVRKQTARKSMFYNFEDGTTIFRLLPQFKAGAKSMFVESMLHHVLLKEDGENKYAPGCLGYYRDEPCYICKFVNWVYRMGPPLLTDQIEQLAARSKLTGQIFVQDRVSKNWEGPFLVAMPKKTATTMGTWLRMAKEMGTPYFCDPILGSNVALSKSGKGLGTRYEVALVPRVESLDTLIPGWEDKVFLDLDEKLTPTISVLTIEEQKAALHRTFPNFPWSNIQADIG